MTDPQGPPPPPGPPGSSRRRRRRGGRGGASAPHAPREGAAPTAPSAPAKGAAPQPPARAERGPKLPPPQNQARGGNRTSNRPDGKRPDGNRSDGNRPDGKGGPRPQQSAHAPRGERRPDPQPRPPKPEPPRERMPDLPAVAVAAAPLALDRGAGDTSMARPSAEIDDGWVLPSSAIPSAAAAPAEVERQLTRPEVADPRDPDGEDVFVSDPERTPGGTITNVVGAKFRPTGTLHAFDAGDATYARGDEIVVETDKGQLLATVTLPSRRQPMHDTLRRVVRRASDSELRSRAKARDKEREIFLYVKDKLRERNIPIKLTRVELPLSPGRVVIYFASEERVDFRDLVKTVSQQFHARVEMRQLGARDEAKLVGGIGACGRELCCSTWLPAFVPISIKMAKDQGLVLNPSKLAGQCGRLKCCLVYEHDTYKEMAKTLPKVGKRVQTPAGNGKVIELDILAQKVRVWFDEGGAETFPGSVVTLLAPPPPAGHGAHATAPPPMHDEPPEPASPAEPDGNPTNTD